MGLVTTPEEYWLHRKEGGVVILTRQWRTFRVAWRKNPRTKVRISSDSWLLTFLQASNLTKKSAVRWKLPSRFQWIPCMHISLRSRSWIGCLTAASRCLARTHSQTYSLPRRIVERMGQTELRPSGMEEVYRHNNSEALMVKGYFRLDEMASPN